jgi:Mg/Co/Ni transporter MgtE
VLVNDVCLSDDWRLLGVDNSMLGLLRRLTPSWLPGARPRPTAPNIIPWKDIQLIDAHQDQEAETQATHAFAPRPTSGQLAELRPADIAEIVHQLSPGEGARLIESLDDETAADTMEEVDTERQRHILENIQSARAADILEAMGPDEAADLLAQLPEEHAQELLKLMKPEESEDVQDLLEYEENSAGGLMTTDYIKLNQTKTVAQALDAVRSCKQQQDMHAAYVYCVADETQDECTLLGVVSLWDLLVASSDQILQDLMETDMITVHPDTDPRTVAQIMAKYNLLAVPVVSQEGILEGVVTVDDALDILLPAGKRRKPARMY